MNILEAFTPIRCFVFAVEGVLTESVFITDEKRRFFSMNSKDIYALKMALTKGYRIWILTHNADETIRKTFSEIGIPEIHFSVHSKKKTLQELVNSFNEDYSKIMYAGDDVPDFAAMKLCGLPCCPADAVAEIKSISKYISPHNGGSGFVRDIIEKVLKLNGHWEMPE